jgi:hypothetical protein
VEIDHVTEEIALAVLSLVFETRDDVAQLQDEVEASFPPDIVQIDEVTVLDHFFVGAFTQALNILLR